jgi:hypothetical protein
LGCAETRWSSERGRAISNENPYCPFPSQNEALRALCFREAAVQGRQTSRGDKKDAPVGLP